MLGVSRSTIDQMIAAGRIAAWMLGAATLIPHPELARLLDGAPLSATATAAQALIKGRPFSKASPRR